MSDTSQSQEQHEKTEKNYNIIVNAEEKLVASNLVSFSEVAALAFPGQVGDANVTFTVTFRKAEGSHHEGSMVAGETVKVIDGTVFNVSATTKS